MQKDCASQSYLGDKVQMLPFGSTGILEAALVLILTSKIIEEKQNSIIMSIFVK